MKRFQDLVPVFLVALSLGSFSAWGQGEATPVTCGELAALTSSIRELVSTIRETNEQDTRRQELELAIAYLQFRSRRIETLEQELRRTEDRKTSSEDFLSRIQEEIRGAEETNSDLPPEEAERARDAMEHIQRRVISEETKLDRFERQIIDLQNEIADGKRQLTVFEDFVLENLDPSD